MCSASFCHWVASSVMLLIFTLRRRLILGDGSLFSLLSRTPRDAAAASKSGLRGGEGPSRRSRGEERGHFKDQADISKRLRRCVKSFFFYREFLQHQ